MIHIIYITVIVLVYFMFAFLFRGQKNEIEKQANVIKEKQARIEALNLLIGVKDDQLRKIGDDMWLTAQKWDETSRRFTSLVEERDAVIKQTTQRNEYLEHIVREMF